MFVIHHSGHGKVPIRNRRAIKTEFGWDKREKKIGIFAGLRLNLQLLESYGSPITL
jgi:hypothetical protein